MCFIARKMVWLLARVLPSPLRGADRGTAASSREEAQSRKGIVNVIPQAEIKTSCPSSFSLESPSSSICINLSNKAVFFFFKVIGLWEENREFYLVCAYKVWKYWLHSSDIKLM